MSDLKITFAEGRNRFAPAATVSGRAEWTLDRPPKGVEIRLYWRTEGRGTEDVSVVERVTVERPAIREARDFRFTLPEGPHSFTGTLVSLRWGVEVIVSPKNLSARAEFSMGPGPGEAVLRRSGASSQEDPAADPSK